MSFKGLQSIYFIGIGGVGMSALARYMKWLGKSVSGYDRVPGEITTSLIQEGIAVNFEDDPKHIPQQVDMVVFTPAIPSSSRQLAFLKELDVPVFKRSQVLGMIAGEYKTIAVAGTHGKTSVTSMLAHIFNTSNIPFMALVGGIMTNYDSNFVISGEPEWIIVEADEYDRSFLTLKPQISVITSVESDHLDIYENFSNMKDAFNGFMLQTAADGTIILGQQAFGILEKSGALTYGYSSENTFQIKDVKVVDGKYTFNVITEKGTNEFEFGWAGRHNIENASAAIAAAVQAGVSAESIKAAIATFKGVKRRFEVMYKSDSLIYIDDYAHHPGEIKRLIESVREMYPSKPITGIFQPHLYSRTRDFAMDFAFELDKLDRIAIMDIYPARELPIAEVSAFTILNLMLNPARELLPENNVLQFVSSINDGILITLGAGNIDRFVQPIKEYLTR